jgi:tetratricopeptide (TPR) repeat protein
LELDPRNFSILQNLALSYHYLRDYRQQAAIGDRALQILPNDIGARLMRAEIELEWHAQTSPLHSEIEAILREDPSAASAVADWRVLLALNERDYAAAKAAVSVLPQEGAHNAGFSFPNSWYRAIVARASGDSAAARIAFGAARNEIEERMRDELNYGESLSVLAMIDAGLGRQADAIREGRRAVELLATDAVNHALAIEHLAVVYAWLGQKEQACQQLMLAAPLPGDLSYGQLRLYPYWDPLRGDPRFEKIVAALAPK